MLLIKSWQEKVENTKGVIRRMTDNTMDDMTNNDIQNTTQKTKDRASWTPLKGGVNSCAPEEWTVAALHVAPNSNIFVVTIYT